MKKIDWTAVTASSGLVFEEQTFEHINNGHKDSYISFVKANIPSTLHSGKLVILHGCVATGTNPGARTLTAGAVFYNGEVYQVPSASFTTTGSQIGIWTLTDVDSGTDESTIKTASSSFTEHVLVNSKFVFASGLSGSGTFDENSSNITTITNGYTQKNDLKIDRIITPIGIWDMDNDLIKNITLSSLGLTIDKITNIHVIIYNDDMTAIHPIYFGTTDPSGNFSVDPTNIVLTRSSLGGTFNNTDYSGSGNRGYITIDYLS